MTEDEVIYDFVLQSQILEMRLKAATLGRSPRVIISVMIGLMKEICKQMPDPEGAMEQLIESLMDFEIPREELKKLEEVVIHQEIDTSLADRIADYLDKLVIASKND